VTTAELRELIKEAPDDMMVVVSLPGVYWEVDGLDVNTSDDPPSLTLYCASRPLPW